MPGDFSRTIFDASKHYSGVLMQQGRVQLDADWNDQLAIEQHRIGAALEDIVGRSGAPKGYDSFRITQTPRGDDLLIAPGRFYVDGLLCELNATLLKITSFPAFNEAVVPYLWLDGRNLAAGEWVEIRAERQPVPVFARIEYVQSDSPPNEESTLRFDIDISAYQNAGAATLRRAVTYSTQPDNPRPPFAGAMGSPSGEGINLKEGSYLVYLEAWTREVNALEDPRIREIALGGPDTTQRLQTVWQVGITPYGAGGSPGSPPASPPDCCHDKPDFNQLFPASTGMMNARTIPPRQETPCVLPPTAGYQRLENQLYRVEIFKGATTRDDAFFVWSRDNGSVESSIVRIDGNDLYLNDLGKDDVLGFAAGQWVEIVDRQDELDKNAPRFLAQITVPPDAASAKVTLSASAAPYAGRDKLRLRRWDMSGPSVTSQGVPIGSGWIDLEGGIQVQFSGGTYTTRDYWHIPARTATGEIEWPPFQIPNPDPVPQPPLGIRRYYARLAFLEAIHSIWSIYDCREGFPPLTGISAGDVSYDGGDCELWDCATVRDALDKLCRENDLRFHNKHLHGWGIVCGLQAICGPNPQGQPRRYITVRSGYAIDCEGNDVILRTDQQLDAFSMIATSPPGVSAPEGEFCLILDPDIPGQFRFEPYQPPSHPWQDVFKGTLLVDFFEDCVQKLIDFVKKQFTPGQDTPGSPVTPAHKNLTAFTNLLIQLGNADNGSYVFLSGDKNAQANAGQEDDILHTFYNRLRQILSSSTYCAMFAKARAFPPYPYSKSGQSTIFGKGYKTHLRVDPAGARAYTMGVDNVIHVYDLHTQAMTLELSFPTAGVVVQDMAFSPDGSQLFVTATAHPNTFFAIATVQGAQFTWSTPVVIPNVALTTLATSVSAAGAITLYAIGASVGLYAVSPPSSISATIQPIYRFNAFGHLVLDNDAGLAFASASSAAAGANPPTSFDQIVRMTLINPTGQFFLYNLHDQQMTGSAADDIFVLPASLIAGTNVPGGELFVTAPSPSGGDKQLLIYSIFETNPVAAVTKVDLGEKETSVRLAYNPVTQYLMMSFEGSYRVKLFRPGNAALETSRHPVQVQPIAIAYSGPRNSAYVLNYTSNSITAISAPLLDPKRQLDLPALVKYRSDIINAFYDLAGGFLQYLKDCFCDHLLVNCPSCDGDTNLYIACCTFSGGQLEKICNFEKRKQVKTFPKVEYWLSLIPIIPIIGKVVESICCAALPNFFGKRNAPQPSPGLVANPGSGAFTNRINETTVRSGITWLQTADFRNMISSSLNRVIGTKQFATDLMAKSATPAPFRPVGVKLEEVAGSRVNEVQTRLTAANIRVDSVATYDPERAGANAGEYLTAPSLSPGDSVTLIVDQAGVVRYYKRTTPEVAALRTTLETGQQHLQDAITSNLQQVAGLQTQITNLQTTHAQALAQRDAQIAQLQTRLAAMDQLNTRVEQLAAQIRLSGPPR